MNEAIGHYELLNVLGTGGLGTVYRARDTRAGRTVAIRVMGDVAADDARRERFLAAVSPFTALSHPHVASLYEAGEHLDRPYLVYEFVPGERLSTLLVGHPLHIRRALDVAIQVADGLAEAHSFGLHHDALTPNNIVITPKGHAKILEFGSAAWPADRTGQHTAARLADRGTSLGRGAVAYMSPEQVLGQAVDHRADVFSLGVILYHMLTGRQPFEAANPSETGVRVLRHTPTPPSRLNSDVPPAVDAIVARALAKTLVDRYGNVAMFAADLREALSAVSQRDASPGAAGATAAAFDRGGQAPWRMVLFVSLFVAALGVAGWTYREPMARLWGSAFGPGLTPVISVTPFVVDGGDESRAYVGAGVAEELARRLGQVPGVTVTGRTTVRTRAGAPAVAAARDTKASLVVSGSIGPGPDGWSSVEIVVDLSDGASGRAVWTGRYQGPAGDIGALQSRVSRDIAARLKLDASAPATHDRASLRVVDPDAYDVYLQGLDAWSTFDTARAALLFESAIAKDPGLVEAQAALAAVLHDGAVFESRVAYSAAIGRMREAAEQAATTDPDLPTTLMALGLSAPTLHEALGYFRKAVEIDPSSGQAHLALADALRDVDPAKAVGFARRAAAADPAQPMAVYAEAAADLAMGQYAEALAAVARGQALAPAAPWWDALRYRVLLAKPGAAHAPVAPPRSVSAFAPGALVRAVSLTLDGRPGEAAGVLAIVTRMYPDFCEARALLAGVRQREGNVREAARLASDILTAASNAAEAAPWAHCAAMAAAGVGDTKTAASWIGRAAADDRALRLWLETSAVLSPTSGIRQKVFPWSNVLGSSQVGRAVADLESAIARARGEAAKILAGLGDAK